METPVKISKKPRPRFSKSKSSLRRSQTSSQRLNLMNPFINQKNEVLARKLERERIQRIIKNKQSRKKSVKKPINNGLPRPHTHSSSFSKSRRPIVPNMYNLMEKGTPLYTPLSMPKRTPYHRMNPIQENEHVVEESVFTKSKPTTFSEYFQNVANEAHQESRQLNAENRFARYMLNLKAEINAENKAIKLKNEKARAERNRLKGHKKNKKATHHSVRAYQESSSYIPIHQVFNKTAHMLSDGRRR